MRQIFDDWLPAPVPVYPRFGRGGRVGSASLLNRAPRCLLPPAFLLFLLFLLILLLGSASLLSRGPLGAFASTDLPDSSTATAPVLKKSTTEKM